MLTAAKVVAARRSVTRSAYLTPSRLSGSFVASSSSLFASAVPSHAYAWTPCSSSSSRSFSSAAANDDLDFDDDANGNVDDTKRGAARVVAESVQGSRSSNNKKKTKTVLTKLSHTSPLRLVPVRSSKSASAGSAIVAVSAYGGGMVSGDVTELDASVGVGGSGGGGARLGLVTQGHGRVYGPGRRRNRLGEEGSEGDELVCRSTLRASVGSGSTLVVAPDPIVLYAGSAFEQVQTYDVERGGTVVAVDWFGAGRLSRGERWDMDLLRSRTELRRLERGELSEDGYVSEGNWNECDDRGVEDRRRRMPALVDAVSLDNRRRRRRRRRLGDYEASDPFGFDLSASGPRAFGGFDAFASVLLHGPNSAAVAARFEEASRTLASRWTRVRDAPVETASLLPSEGITDDDPVEEYLRGLSGRVVLGVTEVDCDDGLLPLSSPKPEVDSILAEDDDFGPTAVARLAASSNEDLCRVLRACLRPLRTEFGAEFYADRIHASATAAAQAAAAVQVPAKNDGWRKEKSRTNEDRGGATTEVTDGAEMYGRSTEEDEERSPLQAGRRRRRSNSLPWEALMLADSALPTGNFAHSSGVEAAAQLGLLHSSSEGEGGDKRSTEEGERAKDLVRIAARSAVLLQAPFVLAGHGLLVPRRQADDESSLQQSDLSFEPKRVRDAWSDLDRLSHAYLSSNGPACRASLDHGSGLLRVASDWIAGRRRRRRNEEEDAAALELLRLLRESVDGHSPSSSSSSSRRTRGHAGPMLGVVSALLDLTAEESLDVLAYGAARDAASAAVRLNLLGPSGGVDALDAAGEGTEEALEEVFPGMEKTTAASPAGCAPVLDAVHPCHDLLAVRLFRT